MHVYCLTAKAESVCASQICIRCTDSATRTAVNSGSADGSSASELPPDADHNSIHHQQKRRQLNHAAQLRQLRKQWTAEHAAMQRQKGQQAEASERQRLAKRAERAAALKASRAEQRRAEAETLDAAARQRVSCCCCCCCCTPAFIALFILHSCSQVCLE